VATRSGAIAAAVLLALAVAGTALPAAAAPPAAGGRVAPAAPAFLRCLDDLRARGQAPALGLMPAPVSGAGVPRVPFAPLMARFPERFAPAEAAAAAATTADAVPGAYDLRATGKLTPIRDQGRYGTCWAFAALASFESGLLPGSARDYSENNVAARAGFSLGYDAGGNSYMAAAYLLRWDGPVDEADDPYAPYAAAPNPSPADAGVDTHVHEVLQLPARRSASDNADLKWAVMTSGAAYTTMYWTSSAYKTQTHAYYSTRSGGNHAVALVGWDDGFPAQRFATAPPGPGAFLVRNSWGEDFGDQGYFWVSYHDTAFGGQSAVFAGAVPAAAGDRIYQHDPLGWVASYRPPGAADPGTAWFAASFTPAEAGTLTAAGFYATAPNAGYEVRVADSVEAVREAPVLARGTLAVPGFHTVPLDEPQTVTVGRRLVIAVRVTTPGYRYPVAIERPYAGYADATAAAGQSYVSGDGASWTDMTALIAATDVCLKGYGRAAGEPPGPDTPPEPSPEPSADPAPEPSESPAPSLRMSAAAGRAGSVVRIPFRVVHPGAATAADVRLTLRTRQGAVVRRQTLDDVSTGARHTWRLRTPSRRGSYVIVAVARLDTGQVSKKATASLRCR
jgi:C1A family cysteine protease